MKNFINYLLNIYHAQHEEQLKLLISKLIGFMDVGYSCMSIKSIYHNHKELIEKLLQYNLCSRYQKDNIKSTPLILLNNDLLYFHRYFIYELAVIQKLLLLNTNYEQEKIIIKHKLGYPSKEQLIISRAIVNNQLSFLTGGPGTGKTTTISIVLIMLIKIYGALVKINICAPTGKAAIKVKDSLTNNINQLAKQNLQQDEIEVLNNIKSTTIHQLLGYKENSIHFKKKEQNLQTDILIIDEASMIGLPLCYKLMTAINEKTIKHIVFIGDPNQLLSVEEGFVFSSIVKMHSYFKIYKLMTSKRNNNIIAKIAADVLSGDNNSIATVLMNQNNPLNYLLYKSHLKQYINLISSDCNDMNLLLTEFNKFTILCSTNYGNLGVIELNKKIEEYIYNILGQDDGTWYNGRPIIINENNYLLKVYNGDIGICGFIDDKPIVYFGQERYLNAELIKQYSPAYVTTVHKSQGSEYMAVYIMLPSSIHNTKELLYTAITRAKQELLIFSSQEAITLAIQQSSSRKSGIEALLQCCL